MLAPGMDLPWVVGVAAAKQNAANLKTYGWELELNWRDRIKDFNYRIGFNLYDSQSEITKFNNETNLLGSYRKGQKIGEIWGYVTDRFYREDDFNADGTLKEGIPIPKGVGKVYPGDILYKTLMMMPALYGVEKEQRTIRATNVSSVTLHLASIMASMQV